MLSPAALSIITAGLPRQAAREGAGGLGRGRRRRRRDRRPRRRHAHPGRRLADDLLRQPPRRRRPRRRRVEGRPGATREAALARPRPARRAARHDQPRRDRLRDHAGRQRRLDVGRRRSSAASAASPAWPRSRSASATPTSPLLRVERLADRAVGGGLVLDARRGRLDLRPVLALLALPPERARHGPARRPASRSSRSPSPPGSARTPPGTSSPATACAMPARRRVRVAAIGMVLLAHVGRGGTLSPERAAGDAGRRASASASPSSRSRSRSSPAPARTRPG